MLYLTEITTSGDYLVFVRFYKIDKNNQIFEKYSLIIKIIPV